MISLRNFCSTTLHMKFINSLLKKWFHRSSCLLGEGENIKKALLVPYQKEEHKKRRKVTVVGAAGKTGVIMAYTLLLHNYCDEVVMFAKKESKEKVCGEALDFLHGTCFRNAPKITICMDMEKTKDSTLIIFNSGVPRSKDQTRLQIAQTNILHFKEIVPGLAKCSPDSVLLVVTNPTDIMTYAAWKYSCFDRNRVIGTGTELDTARFRYHIAKRLGINPISIGGWVIGEHGNSSVPVWSTVNVAGTKLRDIDSTIGTPEDKNNWDALHKQVVKDGATVIGMKGCTQFGIGQTADNIAKAILSNAKTVHAVCTQAKGLYGVQTDCFLSLPCVIGNRGACEIVQLALDDDEVKKLNKSACALDEVMKSVKFP